MPLRMSTTIASAATEVELRDFAQLTIGAYLTGPGYADIWLVVGLDPATDTAELQRMPLTPPCAPDAHILEPKGVLSRVCRQCGYRTLKMPADAPRSSIVTSGPAASYMITADRAADLITPVVGTIYYDPVAKGLYHLTGSPLAWSTRLPVFPKLEVAWSVPDTWTGPRG